MYIVADIGGTKTRLARSRDLKTFDEPVKVDTPQEYGDGVELIRDTIHELLGGEKLEAMAVGIAGPLSADKHSVFKTPHLNWGSRPLADDLSNMVGSDVYLENDCGLVGLGEATAGAGASASIVAYITVSTGVGGCRIVDGIIDRSAEGFEIGGQYMTVEKPQLTLEDMISGTAVEKAFNMKPKDIAKDNPVWEELAEICAYGVHNTILHWSPNRVVMGGSMLNEVGISVPRVEWHVQQIMKKFSFVPPIVHSALGDFGGLHGGLDLIRQRKSLPL